MAYDLLRLIKQHKERSHAREQVYPAPRYYRLTAPAAHLQRRRNRAEKNGPAFWIAAGMICQQLRHKL